MAVTTMQHSKNCLKELERETENLTCKTKGTGNGVNYLSLAT